MAVQSIVVRAGTPSAGVFDALLIEVFIVLIKYHCPYQIGPWLKPFFIRMRPWRRGRLHLPRLWLPSEKTQRLPSLKFDKKERNQTEQKSRNNSKRDAKNATDDEVCEK